MYTSSNTIYLLQRGTSKRSEKDPQHLWLPYSLFSSTIKVLLIRPQSLEPRQKQLIDNGSISEHGGLSRALRNVRSICDDKELYMAF